MSPRATCSSRSTCRTASGSSPCASCSRRACTSVTRPERWNPKMKRLHLRGAQRHPHHRPRADARPCFDARTTFVQRASSAGGGTVLFVGTKKQAAGRRSARRPSAPACSSWCNRWLGGTLTNFDTIASRSTSMREHRAHEARTARTSAITEEGSAHARAASASKLRAQPRRPQGHDRSCPARCS